MIRGLDRYLAINRYYWWLEFSKVLFFLFTNFRKVKDNMGILCPAFYLSGITIPPHRYDWQTRSRTRLWPKPEAERVVGAACGGAVHKAGVTREEAVPERTHPGQQSSRAAASLDLAS